MSAGATLSRAGSNILIKQSPFRDQSVEGVSASIPKISIEQTN